MLDTVVMSGDGVCCSVMFGTLVGVFVFSVMWSELLMTSAISCPLWSPVYACQRLECAFTFPMRTECGMFVMCCMQCCMSVSVSRKYIDVCYCDMFSVVNVYLDHLKFCVVCINNRRYVCCSKCDVVSNECNEPTSCLVQPIGAHCCEVMYFGCFGFRGELGFLNCDDVCMCVVNKQFELLEFVSESVYVDLQYDEISLTFTAGSVCLCSVSSPVVVLGLSAKLTQYPMLCVRLLR